MSYRLFLAFLLSTEFFFCFDIGILQCLCTFLDYVFLMIVKYLCHFCNILDKFSSLLDELHFRFIKFIISTLIASFAFLVKFCHIVRHDTIVFVRQIISLCQLFFHNFFHGVYIPILSDSHTHHDSQLTMNSLEFHNAYHITHLPHLVFSNVMTIVTTTFNSIYGDLWIFLLISNIKTKYFLVLKFRIVAGKDS